MAGLVVEFPNGIQEVLEKGAEYSSPFMANGTTQGVQWGKNEIYVVKGVKPGFKSANGGNKSYGPNQDTEKIIVKAEELDLGFRVSIHEMEEAKEKGVWNQLLATRIKENLKETMSVIDYAIVTGRDEVSGNPIPFYQTVNGNFIQGVQNVITPSSSPSKDIRDGRALLKRFKNTKNIASIQGFTDLYDEVDKTKLVQLGADLSVMGVKVEETDAISDPVKYIGGDWSKFRWGIRPLSNGLEMVETGDPDNKGTDLKYMDEVYFRSKILVVWCITHPEAFFIVRNDSTEEEQIEG
ncbi:hypothetical protein LJB88_02095 [Erysipelotrichaceae bacterium OttesenSCG-928-M19]|nr:hypothetical protein [Erysipelotrichaceae bacterium OttesenSCG-928-M19]